MPDDDLPPTLGWVALDWISTFCSQGPGDQQDEPFHVTDDQLRFLLNVYELDPTTGRRRYRRAALVRGKGHGKSTFAAAIVLFEALGPCRFSHWAEDGTPVGKPVVGPQIRVMANAEDQAGNVYDAVVDMATRMHGYNLDIGLTRINLPDGGSIKPVASAAAARDGGRESMAVADETHSWILPELHKLHQVYVRNLAKRHSSQAWMLEITTAFRPGENSVAENTMSYGMKVAAGEIIDAHLLYDHRQIASGKYDLIEPEQRMLALRESYADHINHVDAEQIVRLWDDPQTDEVDWRRYFLSQVVTAADSFIDPHLWAALADPTLALHDNDRICLGIDTSLRDDGTALVACRLEDGHLERLGYWQRPSGRAGLDWSVPYEEVDAAVRGAFDRYSVARVYADPQYLYSYLDNWTKDFPGRIFSWATHRTIAMAAAIQRFYTAVVSKDRISHSGDSLLTLHVNNTRTVSRQGRILVQKESHHSSNKIDLTIAAILAYEAAADALAAGELKQAEKAKKGVWGF